MNKQPATDGDKKTPGQEPTTANADDDAQFFAASVVRWCEHLSAGLGIAPQHALAVAMLCAEAWLQLQARHEAAGEPPFGFEEAFPRTVWFMEHGEERPPADLLGHADKLDRDAAEILARARKLPEPFAGNLRGEARRLQGVAQNYRLEHRERRDRHAEWEAKRNRVSCHVAARDLAEALAASGFQAFEIASRLVSLADVPGWPEAAQCLQLAKEAVDERR